MLEDQKRVHIAAEAANFTPGINSFERNRGKKAAFLTEADKLGKVTDGMRHDAPLNVRNIDRAMAVLEFIKDNRPGLLIQDYKDGGVDYTDVCIVTPEGQFDPYYRYSGILYTAKFGKYRQQLIESDRRVILDEKDWQETRRPVDPENQDGSMSIRLRRNAPYPPRAIYGPDGRLLNLSYVDYNDSTSNNILTTTLGADNTPHTTYLAGYAQEAMRHSLQPGGADVSYTREPESHQRVRLRHHGITEADGRQELLVAADRGSAESSSIQAITLAAALNYPAVLSLPQDQEAFLHYSKEQWVPLFTELRKQQSVFRYDIAIRNGNIKMPQTL
jgi:hypothetical protein